MKPTPEAQLNRIRALVRALRHAESVFAAEDTPENAQAVEDAERCLFDALNVVTNAPERRSDPMIIQRAIDAAVELDRLLRGMPERLDFMPEHGGDIDFDLAITRWNHMAEDARQNAIIRRDAAMALVAGYTHEPHREDTMTNEVETAEEQCARCGEHGPDLRTLWMACFYAMHELSVPFDQAAIEGRFRPYTGERPLEDLPGFTIPTWGPPEGESWTRTFYTLRVCKACRAAWMAAIQTWFHATDGRPESTGTGVFVRRLGSCVELTTEGKARP